MATDTNTRRKVLVIDDSQMLLGFAKEVLSNANYDVLTAPSAREGVQVAAQDPPDLILLDYVLPDMKGVDVIARLSENGATASVPVIYMTGFGHRVQPGEISGNVIASLNKPFTSDLLKRTIAEHMPERSTAASAQRDTKIEEPAATAAPASVDATMDELPAVSAAPATIEEPHPPDAGGSITESSEIAAAAGQTNEPWWTTPAPAPPPTEPLPEAQSQPETAVHTAPSTFVCHSETQRLKRFQSPEERTTTVRGPKPLECCSWEPSARAARHSQDTLRPSQERAPRLSNRAVPTERSRARPANPCRARGARLKQDSIPGDCRPPTPSRWG